MQKRRILITGSNGLLGQKLVNLLKRREAIHLFATSRGPNRNPNKNGCEYHSIDVSDRQTVFDYFYRLRPTEVIHTAAMTNVDACEQNPEICHTQNVEAVRNLIDACKQYDVRLIHLSTDFIFDGESGPYAEDAIPNPLSVYGRCKWEAEQLIRAAQISYAIVRTVLLYGTVPDASRSNIVLWVRKSLQEGRPIRVVHDQFRSPTLAEDLADGVAAVVLRDKTGVFHISGGEIMSIWELAQRTALFWKLDTSLIEPIDSVSLNQPAKRPPRTGFIILKAQTELGYKPHTLEQGLELLDRQLKSLAFKT